MNPNYYMVLLYLLDMLYEEAGVPTPGRGIYTRT